MREIPLTQGQVAFVDDTDYDRLSLYKWYAFKREHTFYAARMSPRPNRHRIYMHHEVLGAKPGPGQHTDHINGNGTDDRSMNVRLVTCSQNQMNQHRTSGSSQYKGVHWRKTDKKWKAQIQIDGTQKHLGYFISEEAAAKAYDAAATELFGEYARLNFPN